MNRPALVLRVVSVVAIACFAPLVACAVPTSGDEADAQEAAQTANVDAFDDTSCSGTLSAAELAARIPAGAEWSVLVSRAPVVMRSRSCSSTGCGTWSDTSAAGPTTVTLVPVSDVTGSASIAVRIHHEGTCTGRDVCRISKDGSFACSGYTPFAYEEEYTVESYQRRTQCEVRDVSTRSETLVIGSSCVRWTARAVTTDSTRAWTEYAFALVAAFR